MKIAGLIIGVLLIVLACIGGLICLLLPSMTNNRISFDEALLGLIPAVIVFFLGFLITVVSGVLLLKSIKKSVTSGAS